MRGQGMITVHERLAPLDEPSRSALIFRGDVIVFRSVDAVSALISKADGTIREIFAPHDPLIAERVLTPGAYAEKSEALIGTFAKDPAIRDLYRAALQAVGVDASLSFWDRLRLRIQPSGETHMSRRVLNLAPHRDSWGSNVMAQVNWWAPIYAVTRERTMVIYPAHWGRPIANTSADWDFEDLRARRKRGDDRYPLLPVATEQVDGTSAWPVVIDPGDLLCFSSAHLHASVTNTTGVTRFSTEVRTVNVEDLRAGRGAPNVDGAAPRQPLEWFHNLADGLSLAAALNQAA